MLFAHLHPFSEQNCPEQYRLKKQVILQDLPIYFYPSSWISFLHTYLPVCDVLTYNLRLPNQPLMTKVSGQFDLLMPDLWCY